MTEKRFTINDCRVLSNEQILKILNSLIDENEQLEKRLQIYKSDGLEKVERLQRCYNNSKKAMKTIDALDEENEQLKQFKENVIKWVDSQMKFNAKKYIETDDCHFKSENIDLHNFKVFIGIDSDD